MIEINGNKYDRLLSEVIFNMHYNEKVLDELGIMKDGMTYSGVQNERRVSIIRYQNDVYFNRRVKCIVNTVIQSLDIRIN